MSNELKLVLQKYRLKHPTGKYVFPSAQCINEPMKSYALSNKWNEFKTEMDVANGAKAVDGKVVESTIAPDLTMYIFRHTFASDCQAAGVPINVAKEFMGHADISTTAKTYTHMIDEVFNENGEIKSCGRDKCKELIRVAKEFAASGRYGDDFTDFGNEDTGFLNVKTMKAFKERVSATDVCPKLTAVRKSLEDE
jgi:hypothetical protein